MGCAGSVPVGNTFDVPVKMDKSMPSLGAAGPSNEKMTFIVREKLFATNVHDKRIGDEDLNVEEKASACHNQMALLDGDGNPIAVCVRKREFIGQTIKIYSPKPLCPGQASSKDIYKEYDLYMHCMVGRFPFSSTQKVSFDNEKHASMTISRVGSLRSKKRVVKYQGQTAAFIQGGDWEGNLNSYLVTISPGIDPCLIVCLTAVCDEMDHNR